MSAVLVSSGLDDTAADMHQNRLIVTEKRKRMQDMKRLE